MYIHVYKYIYTYTCIYIHTCMSVHIHTCTHIRTHIQHVHIHTRKHAWNKSAAATARGADADARSSARLFRSTQSTTFGTSNARTSLYPLSKTPIPLNPPSPLPNIPQNSSRTSASAVLLFHTDHYNRVYISEEAPHSFTMAPCIVVERLAGKQRCSRAQVGERAGARAQDCTMWLFTRNERSARNKPNPAAAHHTITTVRRPDNTRLSALVRGQSIRSMADLSCPLRRPPRTEVAFWPFSRKWRSVGGREVAEKCCGIQQCCVGARIGVRSCPSMVQAAASTKTNRVGAAAHQS